MTDATPDYGAVFRSLPVALLVVSPDAPHFTILAATDAYLRAARTPRDRVIGTSIFGVLSNASASDIRASLMRVIATSQPDVTVVHSYGLHGSADEAGDNRRQCSRLVHTPVIHASGAITSIVHQVEGIADNVHRDEHGHDPDTASPHPGRTEKAISLLERSGSVLGESLDYAATLTRVAHLAVPDLADWCYVDIVEQDGLLHRLVMAHADPAKADLARRLLERYTPSRDRGQGVWQVIRSGRPELHATIPDELLVAVAPDEAQLQLLRELGFTSTMTVPLRARGRTLGAITFAAAESGRRYDAADLALAEDLARRCAQAVDNARLFRAAQDAEGALRTLNAELEERVVQRTAQFEMANRELEAFSYSVAHDLRAPLRAIDGFSRKLLRLHEADLSEEGLRFLGVIRRNAHQMGLLIDGLLAFSRLTRQTLQAQTVEPRGLVDRLLDELSSEQEGRTVEVRIGDLPACQADPLLLKQVYGNLLSNAHKFTRKREHALIEIGSTCQGGDRVYFVRDNGAGFDMRYADKLFGVFQRLHRAEEFEGTGVGLAMVQRIVHRHGGRIWAESEPGRGATFSFTLPKGGSHGE